MRLQAEMRALVWLACAACLGRPIAHGHVGDGGTGGDDGGPGSDGTSGACAWSAPIPIDLVLSPGDAAKGPWLSEDRGTLYFGLVPSGLPSRIARAQLAGGWMPNPIVMSPSVTYENPFFDESDQTVWFDEQPIAGGTRTIFQLDSGGGTRVHSEIGTPVRQPTLTPDGGTLYLAPAGLTYVIRCSVASGIVTLLNNLPNPGSEQLESPSVTADGSTLYATDHTAQGDIHIYRATMTPAKDGYTAYEEVGTFQMAGKKYFDPNISRDGTTLVFASDFESTQPRIYYVTRAAGCGP